ncbi:ribonuclease H-like domain-containing protein [Tanacetum coccineum]
MRKQVVHKALIESTALIGASILQTRLLGHMLFYILTTSAETLGEEYCDITQVGSMAAVIRNLLELRYLNGDCITGTPDKIAFTNLDSQNGRDSVCSCFRRNVACQVRRRRNAFKPFLGRLQTNRYKARLVANGRSQQFGVDCNETFSPVVKLATIRMVLSLALSRNWPIHQLDVKNAFLNGDLSETVYMYQPLGFVDARFPQHVCRLQRPLYGLKQALRAWFERFAGYALRVGFSSSRCDSSLFIYRHGSEVAYLLIYVDDIVLTASFTDLLQRIISSLHKEFHMTDLGALNYFLGISVTCDSTGMYLSQKKYALELLDKAHMANCNPTRQPVDTESKLVQQVCLHMHDPREPHLAALKRVLRYVRGTLDFGLQLYASITGSVVAYTDADWAGYPTTRRSASGYCVFSEIIYSHGQPNGNILSRSSAEDEYRGVANVVVETVWLRNLLRELHTPLLSATLVYCDNVSAIYMTANPVQHQRTKHIEIDIHFVCDMVARGQVRVLHVSSRYQYADIFTKGFPSVLFEEFRSSLRVRSSPAQTAEEC